MHGGTRTVEPTRRNDRDPGVIAGETDLQRERLGRRRSRTNCSTTRQARAACPPQPRTVSHRRRLPVTRTAPLASVIRPVSSVGSVQLAVESTRRKTMAVPRDPAAESHGSLATAKSSRGSPVSRRGEADGLAVADGSPRCRFPSRRSVRPASAVQPTTAATRPTATSPAAASDDARPGHRPSVSHAGSGLGDAGRERSRDVARLVLGELGPQALLDSFVCHRVSSSSRIRTARRSSARLTWLLALTGRMPSAAPISSKLRSAR